MTHPAARMDILCQGYPVHTVPLSPWRLQTFAENQKVCTIMPCRSKTTLARQSHHGLLKNVMPWNYDFIKKNVFNILWCTGRCVNVLPCCPLARTCRPESSHPGWLAQQPHAPTWLQLPFACQNVWCNKIPRSLDVDERSKQG